MERSLIQQRMSIDRERLAGIFSLVVGGLGVVIGTAMLIGGDVVSLFWFHLVIWLGWVAIGVTMLVRSRRRIRDFEAEHGAGAGTQDYVR